MAKKDEFTRKWITDNAIQILKRYDRGVLTVRGLYYQLVALGMTNSDNHYQRVVKATIAARWSGDISFYAFSDRDRDMALSTEADETDLDTEIERGQQQVRAWMDNYYLNKWENQPYYPEVLIEKKALEGVFLKPCTRRDIGLGACKGYPSLTFLKEISDRMKVAERRGKTPIILYFGDYDPSGEDIPRSIEENLGLMGVNLEVRRIALMEHQVVEWNLPPAPVKLTDSRTHNWDGLGQVELDAVKPEMLEELLNHAVDEIFDPELYSELMGREAEERKYYTANLKSFVNNLKNDED